MIPAAASAQRSSARSARAAGNAASILATGRLADHPGGIWQHRSLGDPGQFGELGAGLRGGGEAGLAGTGVGVAGIGQQVAHLTEETLLGQGHRRGTERVQGEHPGHAGAFGAAHDHHVFAPRSLDAGGSDAEFETGDRVQGGQGPRPTAMGTRSFTKQWTRCRLRRRDGKRIGAGLAPIQTPRAAGPVAALVNQAGSLVQLPVAVLVFLPEPHGQGSLRPIFCSLRTGSSGTTEPGPREALPRRPRPAPSREPRRAGTACAWPVPRPRDAGGPPLRPGLRDGPGRGTARGWCRA